jgi:dTDP-4-dehydrorhamnose reductase
MSIQKIFGENAVQEAHNPIWKVRESSSFGKLGRNLFFMKNLLRKCEMTFRMSG